MKQFLQSGRDGSCQVSDVPAPQVMPGFVLVRSAASLVSAGTERMAVEFARKTLLGKARSRPDLVKQVLAKARTEGVVTAIEAAFKRLDRPQSAGYSSAGTVVKVGEGVCDFSPGDRVACAGAGYAVHAEFIAVPRNLVARIPAGPRTVEFEEAAFATLGSIALHAFRLSESTVGDAVAVIGLGLIGLIAAQIARAAGCVVFGFDPNGDRCRLAEKLGCHAVSDETGFQTAIQAYTHERGADAVLITAATESDRPVTLAGEVARLKGRVVAAGAVGTNVPRRVYYDKELDFRISRSYGPGRYDPEFEERGHDYPAAYVRWTETRNMQAFLELLAFQRVNVLSLITHRFPIERATEAYELLNGREPFLGIAIQYAQEKAAESRIELQASPAPKQSTGIGIGVIGAGNFANAVLLPAFREAQRVRFIGVCASTGASSHHAGKKYGFRYCTSDPAQILADPAVDAVVIATRHDLHAAQVIAALNSGKHVFVEKPLAVSEEELDRVVQAAKRSNTIMMVGFNRRFAPMAIAMKRFFEPVREPLIVQYRVNAGRIPREHWTQQPEQGGRIIGEACHFVDFSGWMIGELPISVSAESLPDNGSYNQDNVVLTLRYPNGSMAVVTYLASGDKSAGKERVEVHGGGRSAVLEDFRRLILSDRGKHRRSRTWLKQDKGHRGECQAFVEAVRTGGASPVLLADAEAVTRATIRAIYSLRSGDAMLLAGQGR